MIIRGASIESSSQDERYTDAQSCETPSFRAYSRVQGITGHNAVPEQEGLRRCVLSTQLGEVMISEATKIEGALFTVPKDKRREKGPLMEGQFQIQGQAGKFEGAAWIKDSKGTRDKPSVKYYSLQLELTRDLKYYGAMFPATDKKSDKYPDYYGTLNLGRNEGDPILRIAGWKRKAKSDGRPFISILIEPPRQQGSDSGTTDAGHEYTSEDAELPI